MANKQRRNMNWEARGQGEMRGPNGFRAETANGTAFATGTGHNRDEPYSSPEIEPRAVWPAGRSNRTGE